MNTITTLLVSMMIIALVGTVATTLILPSTETSPIDYPAEINTYQLVKCTSATQTGNGYTYTVPTNYRIKVVMYAKNLGNSQIKIKEVEPVPLTGDKIKANVALNPDSFIIKSFPVNWKQTAAGSYQGAMPGDMLAFSGSTITQTVKGTLYILNNIPNTPERINYCPFGGAKYSLNTNGKIMFSKITSVGCAGTHLTDINSPTFFALTNATIKYYYYKKYDYPFLLSFFTNKGKPISLYMRPVGTGVMYKNKIKTETTLNNIEGIYYDQGKTYLINNAGNIVGSTSTYIANKFSVALGVGRERPTGIKVPEIKLTSYFLWWWFIIPGSNVHIDYYNNRYVLYNAWGIPISYGPIPMANPGDDVTSILRNYGVVVINNPDKDHDNILTITAKYRHSFYLNTLNQRGDVSYDFIIGWEDLAGFYPLGSRYIDGDGDEWIRTTYFKNGTWRITLYLAKGGAIHTFYLGNKFIYIKPAGASYSNYHNGVYHELNRFGFPRYVKMPIKTANVGSYVDYIGIFRSPLITISHVPVGSTVTISGAGKTYKIKATSPTVRINLLDYYTLTDIIKTVKRGGFTITVGGSLDDFIGSLPTQAKIHIVDNEHDYWALVSLPIKVECNGTLMVNSASDINFEASTPDYKYWTLKVNNEEIGMFTQVVIKVSDGTVTIIDPNNVHTLKGPLTITLTPTGEVGVMKSNVELMKIQHGYKVIVTGKSYTVQYSIGK